MTPQPTPVSAAVQTLAPWQSYICHACGYIYNEAEGDPDSGLAAGTRFTDIPEDWACPLCGVTKSDFERYEAPSLDALRAQASDCATAWTNTSRSAHGVIIVGAGRAGWQLAEALRARDSTIPITIVTACAGDVYDKPLLSVALARRIAPEKLIKETGAAAARRLKLRLLPHTQAVRICRKPASCAPRAVPCATTSWCWPMAQRPRCRRPCPRRCAGASTTWAPTCKLRAALGDAATTGPKDVLIVGAGLIGSELANDLALGGHRVTLLDVQPEPLARWHADKAGAQVLQAWKDLPIRFVGEVKVASVERLALDAQRSRHPARGQARAGKPPACGSPPNAASTSPPTR
ncbi:MAG: rubredoxin [Comamonadaceae bacterium]|nr:rubredoxin [Comamonadaceae bacterium]